MKIRRQNYGTFSSFIQLQDAPFYHALLGSIQVVIVQTSSHYVQTIRFGRSCVLQL